MKRKFYSNCLGILLLLFSFPSFAQNSRIEENKVIAKQFIEAWNNHDSVKVASLFTPTCLYRDMAFNTKFTTNLKLISFVHRTVAGAPDLTFRVTSVMASDTMATVEWIWKGTYNGSWVPNSSANIPFTILGVSVLVIKNGQIIRNYDYYDGDSFRKMMVPTPTNKKEP
jgi:steroid delta-isomerase-like uncharacterized protein